MKHIRVGVCALALAYLAAAQNGTGTQGAPAPNAQVTSMRAGAGSLAGNLKMSDGTAAANATVRLENTSTGASEQTVTDSAGNFRFDNLATGQYRLTPSTAQLNGEPQVISFDATRGNNVTITMGTPATVATPTATVSTNIIESQTSLDMTTPQIEYPRNTKDITYLPQPNYMEMNGQAYGAYNLSLLNPGVGSNNSLGSARGPVVGGQRPTSNNFYLDGVDNNNRGLAGPLVYIPNDATSEFIAYQNLFPPDLGHTGGGQFDTVVKTGTNGFHGELYDYLMNRNLDAIDQAYALQGAGNGGYDQNRLGGNLGFPIIRNHLYFFGDFEYIPLHYTGIPGGGGILAPTAGGYTTLAGVPGISATNLGVLQANVPAATTATTFLNVNGTEIPAGFSPIQATDRQQTYVGVGALDWDISNSDQVRFRYDQNELSANNNGAALPQFYTPIRDRSLLSNVSWYHNFSPNFVNELRAGYTRFDQALTGTTGSVYSGGSAVDGIAPGTFPGQTAFPNISILDANLNLGPGLLRTAGLNTYNGADNMTFTFGRHQIRAGGDFRRFIGPLDFTSLGLGAYAYSSLSNFLFDLTPDISAERTFGNLSYAGNNWDSYAFVNDKWQVAQNLTVSLGVSYSYVSVPASYQQQALNAIANVPGVLSFNSPNTQNHNFAPMVGVAWAPGFVKNTVFRAGFTMNYDTTYYNSLIPSIPPGFTTTEYGIAPGFGPGGFFGFGGLPVPVAVNIFNPTVTSAQARAMTTSYIPDQQIPYTMNWHAGLEQTILHRMLLDVNYVGVKAVHLPTEGYLNQTSAVTAANSLPVYFSTPSAATLNGLTTTLSSLEAASTNPLASAGFTSPIQTFFNNGWSWYNGLDVRATQRFSGGFQFQANYTWSHLFDNMSGPLYSFPWSTAFDEVQTGPHTSVYDHRQDASLTALWDMGGLGGHSFNWVRDVLTNFTIGGTYRYETQPYLPLFTGANTGLTAFNGVSSGVFVNPNGTAGVGSGVTPLTNSAGQIVAYQATNPNAQYVTGAAGTYSASYPRIGFNPMNNFDMMAIKGFGIKERFRLELRGDAYNVFNHPQFTLSNPHDISSMNLGLVNLLNPASGMFDNPAAMLSSNPRTLQVALKLIW